jgi:hypothetical protein
VKDKISSILPQSKIMKYLLSAFLSLNIWHCFAQPLTGAAIEGTWRIDSVKLRIPAMDTNPEQINEIEKGFLKAHFIFSKDSTFVMRYAPGEPTSLFFADLFPAGQQLKWVFLAKDGSVHIGTPADNYTVMILRLLIVDGNSYFIMEEEGFAMMTMWARKL